MVLTFMIQALSLPILEYVLNKTQSEGTLLKPNCSCVLCSGDLCAGTQITINYQLLDGIRHFQILSWYKVLHKSDISILLLDH